MSSLQELMQAYRSYGRISLILLTLVALMWYTYVYVRALRPREGTLEWITAHDRPRFTLRFGPPPVSWRDVLAVAGLAVLSLIGLSRYFMFRPIDYWASMSVDLRHDILIQLGILPVLTAGFSYCLFRQLFGRTVAVLGVVIILLADMASGFTVDTLVLLSAAFFACRFVNQAERGNFAANSLNLVLLAASLTFGFYFHKTLYLLALTLLIIVCAACFVRYINLGKPDGYLLKTLGLFLLSVAVTMFALCLPGALIRGMRFPQLLVSGQFYALMADRFLGPITAGWDFFIISGGFGEETAYIVGLDAIFLSAKNQLTLYWPFFLISLFGLCTVICGLIRRRDGRSLFILLLLLGAFVMWLPSKTLSNPIFCVLCIGYAWSNLLEHRKRALVGVGAGSIIAIEAAHILKYFI